MATVTAMPDLSKATEDPDLAAPPRAEPAERSAEEWQQENTQLRRLLGEAARLAEFGRYAAKLNHELRQPLFAIKGLAQLLLDRDDPLDPGETREFARSIVEQAERMGTLVNHLRTLSLPASHRPAEALRSADVAAVVARVMGLLAARLKNGPEVSVTVDAGLPRPTIAEDALQQILINLATNALDALSSSGRSERLLQLRARLSPTTSDEGAHPPTVELVMGDSGKGIDALARARLFEPFFSTKTDDTGTGLGLAVSRDLARAAGGDLTLAPDNETDGHGLARPSRTIFVLTLPVASGEEAAGGSSDSASPSTPAADLPPEG